MAKHFNKNNQKEKKAPQGAAGDDRNLVLVDEDFKDADFEDQVWLFWKRHGSKVIVGAVLVFCAALGAIFYVERKKLHVQALQNAYAQTTTAEERLAFAQENRSDPMAGSVFYMLGNEAAAAGNFELAGTRYGEAATVFSTLDAPEFSLVRDRAKMAEAIALAKTGKKADALARFESLAESLATDDVIRGQAMYNLAVAALAENNLAVARKWVGEMDRSLSTQNMWQNEKNNLIRLEPTLLNVPASNEGLSENPPSVEPPKEAEKPAK